MRNIFVLAGLLLLVAATPLQAQRDPDLVDRMDRREILDRDRPGPLDAVAPSPSTNAFLKLASSESNGDHSPSLGLGLQRKGVPHTWSAELNYKYRPSADDNRNSLTGIGTYKVWTGSGNLSPVLYANASHADRFGANRATNVDLTGEITRGAVSVAATAGYGWFAAKGSERVTDFIPAAGLYYTVDDNNDLGIDYTFRNDVDGEDSFGISYKRTLVNGYSFDVVVYKHADFRFRIRKNFAPFRSRLVLDGPG